MQNAQIKELNKVTNFSQQLTGLLQQICRSPLQNYTISSIRSIEYSLVSLTCQTKNLLHYKHCEDRVISERCLRLIEQILTQLMRRQQSASNIVDLFLSHLFSHCSCYISYLFFHNLVAKNSSLLLSQIDDEKLYRITTKILNYFEQEAAQINFLKSLSSCHTADNKLCTENLDQFLKCKFKPVYKTEDKYDQSKYNNKIPPLIIPTSKSINSSRHSAKSKEDRTKGGLEQMRKLASSLGESFITVQLGSLLANKRTQQIRQFTENQQYRQNYLQQLETQRVNTSRLMIQKQVHQNQNDQNSRRYYKKVLTINTNLLLRKVSSDKASKLERKSEKKILLQLITMGLVGLIPLNSSHQKHINKISIDSDYIEYLQRQLLPINEIMEQMMQKASFQTQKMHLNLLMNKNKTDAGYHYEMQRTKTIINNELLESVSCTKNQFFGISKGSYHGLPCAERGNCDYILSYLHSLLQELLGNCNMSKNKFYSYQSSILGLLGFYLKVSQSTCISYAAIQLFFPLILNIKRQLVELSHPIIIQCSEYSFNPKQTPLIVVHDQLLANFLLVLSGLLTNNKHVQKLISNTFIKSIYFLELVQFYVNYLFQNSKYSQIIDVMHFYHLMLKIYSSKIDKNQDGRSLKMLFQHLAGSFCQKNGCIAKMLIRHESLLSVNVTYYEEQEEYTNTRQFLHQLLFFIHQVYYLCGREQSQPLLEEEIASFYVRFSLINFIKLYSSLTVTELTMAQGSHLHELTTKQSPHPNLSAPNFHQIFMIDLVRILTSISINRTPQISKKIRQYRILEFFVRQFQLQFCIADNIEKYRNKNTKIYEVKMPKKPKNTKTQVIQKNSYVENNNKPTVPNLNLTGKINTMKHQNNKQQIKNSTNKTLKKSIPALKIPIKTQISQGSHKGYLDDLLLEVSGKNDKKVPQVSQFNLKLDNLQNQVVKINMNQDNLLSQKRLVYVSERKIRKIYSNKYLHAESLLLILSLILDKGLLDAHSCDQFPISNGKINTLYILHYHLNEDANVSVISLLAELVTKIKPYLSGQRLLKLLSSTFTDLSQYKDWKKLNAGAYGVIYCCKTFLQQPNEVAIKQVNFPKSIYERCTLHDIFSEITALQNFRLDQRVTTMYNYGVYKGTYVIIMKKYQYCLRIWLLQHKESLAEMLPQLLTIYRSILQTTQFLHDHNLTHYDIKADNILLQVVDQDSLDFKVVFADFGECKIYQNQKQELDTKSRGTECIKSPQMLTLSLHCKKQSDKYDRRKKIGTTRASDIWSLGCLLYEIITGQYLFHRADWVNFYLHVTTPQQELLTPSNVQKMHNNQYLLDFLQFVLIRDPNHRPSIHHIIAKFDTIYALLINRNPQPIKLNPSPIVFNQTLDHLLSEYVRHINYSQSQKKQKSPENNSSKPKLLHVQCKNPKVFKIMQDIYFCESIKCFKFSLRQLCNQGITHMVSTIDSELFNTLVIDLNRQNPNQLAYKLFPQISDILRQVLLLKGKLLFVNDHTNFATNLLIFTLSYWFRCSVFETWCLINTQILQFPTFTSNLTKLSSTLSILNKIEAHIQSLPKLQCICGSVTIILRRRIIEKKGQCRTCRCKKKKLQTDKKKQSYECFSLGCSAYLQFLKKRYNINWDHLKWLMVNEQYFLSGYGLGVQNLRTQMLLNLGAPAQNLVDYGASVEGWKVKQCKICEMWMLGCSSQDQIYIIMNNLIKRIRQGIMIPNAQQNFKMKTPALNYYTLSKLHMTSP